MFIKNFLFGSCVCVCMCVRAHVCVCHVHVRVCHKVSVCGVARWGGLECISVLLQLHGYIQCIARVLTMFIFGAGLGWGREQKKN